MTTMEALNATGPVYAVPDGVTYVSVRPVGGTMDDWINEGSGSIESLKTEILVRSALGIRWD